MKIFVLFGLLCCSLAPTTMGLTPSEVVKPEDDPHFMASSGTIHPTTGFYYTVCTGVVIHRNLILTSANCILTIGFAINTGSHIHRSPYIRYIPHPQFNRTTWENDIAIFQILSGIKDPVVAKLPKQGQEPTLEPASIYAFSFNGTLQRATQQSLVSIEECRAAIKQPDTYTLHNVMCTKSANFEIGGAGAPLIQNGIVIGLASPRGLDEAPNVSTFTPIHLYADWIEEMVRKHN